MHSPPSCPQSEGMVPVWQTPSALQQPAQFEGPQGSPNRQPWSAAVTVTIAANARVVRSVLTPA
jgi:hypothetical protein